MTSQFLFTIDDDPVAISLISHSAKARPIRRITQPAVTACVWTWVLCSFSLPKRNLGGRFTVDTTKGSEMTEFSIGPLKGEERAAGVDGYLLNARFFTRLAVHGGNLATFQGRWYPPGSKIPGSKRRAGQDGHVTQLRSDRGRGRNSDRPWNHDDEVRRTADVYNQFAKVDDPTYNPFGTARAREEAIAKRTRIWSASTVHRQLQIARDRGWIIGKTIGTPRRRRKQ